jgi:PAS domain S-box-containing protein
VYVTGQERPAPHEDYQELFDFTPAAYLVTDSSGMVRQANRRASRLLGTTGRFLAGRSLSSFVDAEQRAAFRERLGRAEQLEAAAPWLLRVRPRGGEPVTVAVSVTAARDPHRQAGRPALAAVRAATRHARHGSDRTARPLTTAVGTARPAPRATRGAG